MGKVFFDPGIESVRRRLQSDADYLRLQGIGPKAKMLPPQVVRYLCEKYDIEVNG